MIPSNTDPYALDVRGNRGLGGWDVYTPAQRYLDEVCSTRGLVWREVRNTYQRSEDGTHLECVVYAHVGVVIEGEGRTLSERWYDVYQYLWDNHDCTGFTAPPPEEQSSSMLGPGLYEVDALCGHMGWWWASPGSWHHSEDRSPDGSLLIGGLVGYAGKDREEVIYAIAQWVVDPQ